MNTIVPAQVEHARSLAPNLRRADLVELSASTRAAPEEALLTCIGLSVEAYAWLHGEEVVGLFGVTELAPGIGCPWAVGSPLIERERAFLFSDVQPYIERFNRRYPRLENVVHASNTVHIRYLERCGFTILPPRRYGPKGALFHPFFKEL